MKGTEINRDDALDELMQAARAVVRAFRRGELPVPIHALAEAHDRCMDIERGGGPTCVEATREQWGANATTTVALCESSDDTKRTEDDHGLYRRVDGNRSSGGG